MLISKNFLCFFSSSIFLWILLFFGIFRRRFYFFSQKTTKNSDNLAEWFSSNHKMGNNILYTRCELLDHSLVDMYVHRTYIKLVTYCGYYYTEQFRIVNYGHGTGTFCVIQYFPLTMYTLQMCYWIIIISSISTSSSKMIYTPMESRGLQRNEALPKSC